MSTSSKNSPIRKSESPPSSRHGWVRQLLWEHLDWDVYLQPPLLTRHVEPAWRFPTDDSTLVQHSRRLTSWLPLDDVLLQAHDLEVSWLSEIRAGPHRCQVNEETSAWAPKTPCSEVDTIWPADTTNRGQLRWLHLNHRLPESCWMFDYAVDLFFDIVCNKFYVR